MLNVQKMVLYVAFNARTVIDTSEDNLLFL